MGWLSLLFLIFVVTVVVILMFPPDVMSDGGSHKADVKDLWGIIKLCQTAGFGQPSLRLTPAKRSVVMDLHFLDENMVSVDLPLLLKKQQKEKTSYLKLFASHNLRVVEFDNKLTLYFDRKDEHMGQLIAQIYKDVFEASDDDIVKFSIKTVKSDIGTWRHFEDRKIEFIPNAQFEAHSSKYQGKTLARVQLERILGAVYFLLYPPLIIISFKYFGLNGMCWAALLFFGFFAVYNPIFKKTSIADSIVRGSILYCLLLAATLLTQNNIFLQSIPSIIGFSTAIISASLALGIKKPKSKKEILEKKSKPREFIFNHGMWTFGGVGLLIFNEWARREFSLEGWIFFFGLVRIELMIVMAVIFTPAYVFFLHSEQKRKG